jgi:hypothetical protein
MKKHLIILPYKMAIAVLLVSITLISCDKDSDPLLKNPFRWKNQPPPTTLRNP